jgi:hypothetical protein
MHAYSIPVRGRSVPTRERGIINSVELPGHETYFLLMKSAPLKRHKRAQSTGFIKEKVFYVSLKLFQDIPGILNWLYRFAVPGNLFDT